MTRCPWLPFRSRTSSNGGLFTSSDLEGADSSPGCISLVTGRGSVGLDIPDSPDSLSEP